MRNIIDQPKEIFDVVICGGGLAGLTLARQLKQREPGLSILVLDRTTYPVPTVTHKVGESSTEIGAYYLGEVLGLADYLKEEHFQKLGLRYFYDNPGNDFAQRPEFGVSSPLASRTYQMERGRLENYLWAEALKQGVLVREDIHVKDVLLADDEEPHRILYHPKQNADQIQVAGARWLVDAMGRRRFLQKKLNLTRKVGKAHSAAWFRLDGALDVSTWVAPSNTAWHSRVCEKRWYSTNHLMGRGYWVWLIPLAPCQTSVGIVTDDACQPFATYNTLEKAKSWLATHEPLVAAQLDQYPILDFKTMHDYSYSSHKVFSAQRWSCVGDASSFTDPYYSVGLNLIAFANSITCQLIDLQRQNKLSEEYVEHVNHFYLSLNDTLTHTIQPAYEFYGNALVMSLKTIWDFYIGVSLTDPQFYNDIYLDPKLSHLIAQLIRPVSDTQARMIALFKTWAKRTSGRFAFQMIDYNGDLPTWNKQLVDNLPPRKQNVRLLLNSFKQSVDKIEELAHVIFLLAVEDVMPEKLALFAQRPWLNTAAITLDSDRWEQDGLFRPKTTPRDYRALEEELRRLYRTAETMSIAPHPL